MGCAGGDGETLAPVRHHLRGDVEPLFPAELVAECSRVAALPSGHFVGEAVEDAERAFFGSQGASHLHESDLVRQLAPELFAQVADDE